MAFFKIIKFVLEIFNNNLFTLHHSLTVVNSLFSVENRSLIDLLANKIVVSSAKRIKFRREELLCISFTYIKNSRRPNIDLCGIPYITGSAEDSVFL